MSILSHECFYFGPYLASFKVDPAFSNRMLQVGKTLKNSHAKNLAGKIKMAGDHTDISAMMKDFPNYKKNFTRINMITDELNQMKLKYDNRILKHYKDLKAFQGKVGPDILAKRADLLGKIAMEKKNWFKQTGLNIGEPKFNKQGKMFMDFTTERLSDIDSPRTALTRRTL